MLEAGWSGPAAGGALRAGSARRPASFPRPVARRQARPRAARTTLEAVGSHDRSELSTHVPRSDSMSTPNLRRVPRRAAVEAVVETGRLEGHDFPVLLRPTVPGVALAEWAALNAETIENQVAEHGGVLLRGFDVES